MNKKVSILILAMSVISMNSHADVARRSGNDAGAMAKAQMMMRQLSEENTSLQTENGELKKQLEAIKSKIASIKADKSRLSQSLDSSKNIITKYKENTGQLRNRILQDRDRMKELIGKFKELIAAFRVVEQDKAMLKTNLADNKKEMLNCAENNVKLVKTNHELVQQYLNKGVWDSLKQAEPVTQLSQVQVEKLAQEYSQTIDLLKISANEQGQ